MGSAPAMTFTCVVLIIGAGPAGLATAACLARRSVPFVVLEREDCAGSLWKKMTYDRLHLHLPRHYCELPLLPFPESYPQYPSRDQFVAYLDNYAKLFHINPMCNTTVTSAEFAAPLGSWIVTAQHGVSKLSCKFTAKTLVVATGENGEAVVPFLSGQEEFAGKVIHAKDYRNGHNFKNQKVLVVGSGNTGMEISLDLANFGTLPTLVARSPVN
jgi:indole-3-pyruvate monooxygenase